MTHAKLSPSAADKWLNCPGSIQAEEKYTTKYGNPPSSSFAEEGTMAHTLGETCLNNGTDPVYYIGDKIDNKEVTEDMAQAVQKYVDYTRVLEGKLMVETKIDLRKYIPEGFGTCDAYVLTEDVLHIIDYKHGVGVKVFADNNPQMKLYALGIVSALDFEGEVHLHIVQPLANNFSFWQTTSKDLLIFGEEVKIKAAKVLNSDAPRIPSDKACKWCKAKATCPELADITNKAIAMDFNDMEEENIVYILENEKLITSLINSVKEHAMQNIPRGYKLIPTTGNRKWTDEATAAKLLGERAYEQKLISPTQALKLKLLPPGIDELIYKPEGDPKLVKDGFD